MAQITITPTYDGDIGANTGDFNTLLTSNGGKSMNTTTTGGSGLTGFGGTESVAVAANALGTVYGHRHVFMEFDLQPVQEYLDTNPGTSVTSAYLYLVIRSATGSPTIKLREGNWTGSPNISTWFNAFTTTQYYSGPNYTLGAGLGINHPLNTSEAISDISTRSTLKVAIIDEEYVNGGDTPANGDVNVVNFYYTEDTTSSNRPVLVVTLTDPIPGPKGIKLTSGRITLNSGKITIQG